MPERPSIDRGDAVRALLSILTGTALVVEPCAAVADGEYASDGSTRMKCTTRPHATNVSPIGLTIFESDQLHLRHLHGTTKRKRAPKNPDITDIHWVAITNDPTEIPDNPPDTWEIFRIGLNHQIRVEGYDEQGGDVWHPNHHGCTYEGSWYIIIVAKA